jgi:predicted ArsR family transcriptional regulator
MIWAKPARHDERRVREFLLNTSACSETAASLATKLGVSHRRCRSELERLADEGLLRRREFGDIEPIYYRYPGH